MGKKIFCVISIDELNQGMRAQNFRLIFLMPLFMCNSSDNQRNMLGFELIPILFRKFYMYLYLGYFVFMEDGRSFKKFQQQFTCSRKEVM